MDIVLQTPTFFVLFYYTFWLLFWNHTINGTFNWYKNRYLFFFFQQSAWYDGALHKIDKGNFFDILSRTRVFVVISSPPYIYNVINAHVYCRAKKKTFYSTLFHKNNGILIFGKFPNAIQPNTLNWPRSLFKKWPSSIKCDGMYSIRRFAKKTKNKCLKFVWKAKFFHFEIFSLPVAKIFQNRTCLKRSKI